MQSTDQNSEPDSTSTYVSLALLVLVGLVAYFTPSIVEFTVDSPTDETDVPLIEAPDPDCDPDSGVCPPPKPGRPLSFEQGAT